MLKSQISKFAYTKIQIKWEILINFYAFCQ